MSRSGFYAWRGRTESATHQRRAGLTQMITAVFEHNHRTYGYRRVHAVLARSGVECSPELVRKLMRAAGLVTVQPKPWKWSLTRGVAKSGWVCVWPGH
ncbi:MAG TPA: IS3 family transposase [Candidatus Stackebrandtia excrementipullorum]|nr:IS3 family transposase [Candidatus Stackebrandtia excrementipullorum]